MKPRNRFNLLPSTVDSASTRLCDTTASERSPWFKRWFRWVKNGHFDLYHDFKSTRWLRALGWFVVLVWIGGLSATVVYISVGTVVPQDKACLPDGSFRVHPESFNLWASSGFFQITLGGGRLPFEQAKAIDIVWDIVVGRGGQLLLAYISWKVLHRYVYTCIEVQSINYDFYRTVYLEREPSIWSLWSTIKTFFSPKRLQSKVAMTFIILNMVFLVAFPSLVSAMSGYDTNNAAFIRDPSSENETWVDFGTYGAVEAIIHDGWRIGLEGNHLIQIGQPGKDSDPVSETYADGVLSLAVYQYVSHFGVGGLYNETTRFKFDPYGRDLDEDYLLDSPALNISVNRWTANYRGNTSYELGTKGVIEETWARSNETLGIDYINRPENTKCQTLGDYRWGFSFLQLFIFLILVILWSIGIYIMWLKAHMTMSLRKRNTDELAGKTRAILELSTAIRQELQLDDVGAVLIKEKHLEERIDTELKGGTISYASTNAKTETYSFRMASKKWITSNQWLTATLILASLVCMPLVLFEGYAFLTGYAMLLGMIIVRPLTSTIGSKTIFLFYWAILCALLLVLLAYFEHIEQ